MNADSEQVGVIGRRVAIGWIAPVAGAPQTFLPASL